MAKMSNFKFRVIVIPIIAFLAVAVLIATILANVYPATLDWYLGRGEKHIVTISGVSARTPNTMKTSTTAILTRRCSRPRRCPAAWAMKARCCSKT